MGNKKRVLADNLDARVKIIFDIMDERNISNKEMSAFVGVSESAISEWGKGRSRPGAEVMPMIADFLDCSIDYLMCRTDNPYSHKLPLAASVNYINGGTINGGSQNQIAVNMAQLDDHKKLLIDLYDKLSPTEQVQLLANLFNKTSK